MEVLLPQYQHQAKQQPLSQPANPTQRRKDTVMRKKADILQAGDSKLISTITVDNKGSKSDPIVRKSSEPVAIKPLANGVDVNKLPKNSVKSNNASQNDEMSTLITRSGDYNQKLSSPVTSATTTTQSANVSTDKLNKMSKDSPKKSALSQKLLEIDNKSLVESRSDSKTLLKSGEEQSPPVSKDNQSLVKQGDRVSVAESKDSATKASDVKSQPKVRDNQSTESSVKSSKAKSSNSAENSSTSVVVEKMQAVQSKACNSQQSSHVQGGTKSVQSAESEPAPAETSPANSESPGCDSNSEASNDSGRGGSVTENLSSMCSPEIVRYEFNFPSELCGRLIGRLGKNINSIKEQSSASVALQNNPFTPEFQICIVEGTQSEVEKALSLIRQKFPRAQFSQLDMSPINQPVPSKPAATVLMPNIMQLSLPEGVSVDVVVSSIVDAGHVFIQQPTHPSFPSLERLDQFMLMCYSQDNMVPPLPHPIEVGVICVAPAMDGWYRAQIVQVYEETNECDVRFVDYGGYERLAMPLLKQIRSDFMTLPFQSVECYISNITPLQGEEYFSDKAASVLEELTHGKILQAQVINRAEDGIPYIHIYQINGERVIFVNRELVNRKVTRGIEIIQ